MNYTIKNFEIVREIHAAYRAGKWTEAYTLVFNEITDFTGINEPKAGVEPGAWLWIKGAKDVNSGTGAFA